MDHCLGLLPQEWETFYSQLTDVQKQILKLKQEHLPEATIATKIGCSLTQVQRKWAKLLEQAWEIRNHQNESLG